MTRRRVLVVEDNPPNLKLVGDVLQYAGYDVIAAQSGEEGVRVAREDPPDLAVTAFAMAEDRQRASLAGFDGYLEKPISVRALPGQIAGFLGATTAQTPRPK